MITPRELAQMMAERSDQQLLAMFASPDDWTADALDSAKAELRRRGLDSPSECHPLEPERPDRGFDHRLEADDNPDIYEYFGTYSNTDAQLLLDAFVTGGIDYTLDVDEMGLANMPAVQAASGGTFGAGVGVAIGVHSDDSERAMKIRLRVLKIVV